MNAHRSRSLGMAALVFILISLTAAVFYGAAPVRAEDVSTPTPIVIDGDTATVEVKLYTDESHNKPLGNNTPVLSTDTLYGSFSANFKPNHNPSAAQNVAEYSLPSTVKLLKDEGGSLYDGLGKEAGTWKCGNNKLILLSTKTGLIRIRPKFMLVLIFHSSWQMRKLAPAIQQKSSFPVQPKSTLRP